MSRLGDLIRLERTRRGLSTKQVARMCAVSDKYLQDVEAGKRIIADDQARRILKRIGLEHQTEADFSLDDIAAAVDLHTAAPQIAAPVPQQASVPRPVAALPAEEGQGGGIWLDALSSVLKEVPVYNAAWQVTDHRTLASRGGKIEGGAAEKVLYFLVPDNRMRGFRILGGDRLLVVPAHSPIDGAIMLVRWLEMVAVRKIKVSGDTVLLLSYDDVIETEAHPLSAVRFVGRCVRLEAEL